jgi:glycosyltransferase involved in cell wall biosynthesis
MGGGQVLLLSIIPAALEVAGDVVVVAPMGGDLELALQREFGARISTRNVTLPSLTHGRKGLWDVLRLIHGSVALLPACFAMAMKSRLLYGNGARLFPVLMLVSVLTRRPCCYHVHINFGFLERMVLLCASRFSTTWKIIVNSEDTYQKLLAVAPRLAQSKKLMIIENGLSPRYGLRSYLNRVPRTPIVWHIGVFGVLRPEKGQDTAIEAARRLDNVELFIVGRIGEGAETWVEGLKRSAPRNVQFHDAVPDIIDFIDEHQIHINLVPSRWAEPFGLVAIEGMAASCVTLVSEFGALPAVAKRTGALIFDGGVEDLIRTLTALISGGIARIDSVARSQFDATMSAYGPDRLIGEIKAMLQGGLNSSHDA